MTTQRSGGNQSVRHSALVKLVTEYLQLRGAWLYKVWGGPMSRPGVGDILAVLGGRGLMLEAKTGAARLSPAQVRERDAFVAAGGVFVECRDLDDLEDALLAAGLVARGIVQRRGEVR